MRDACVRAFGGSIPLTSAAVVYLTGSALGSAVALGLDCAERWLCPLPLTHVAGLSILTRGAIYATTVVLHGRFDVAAVLEELTDPGRRITMVSLVPTTLVRLLDAGLSAPPTLRWVLLGGAPVPPFGRLLGTGLDARLFTDLSLLGSLAAWDQRTMMPPGGAPARGQQMATLRRTDCEASQVVISQRIHSGHFRRLAPNQSAAGLETSAGNARDD